MQNETACRSPAQIAEDDLLEAHTMLNKELRKTSLARQTVRDKRKAYAMLQTVESQILAGDLSPPRGAQWAFFATPWTAVAVDTLYR